MRKLKNIYLLLGKSGSGKTTVQTQLEKEFGLKPLISYTTRAPRHKDETGHIFVSKEVFDALENKIAYAEFAGNEYCSTAEQIDESDIYVIDVQGIKYLKQSYNGNKAFKVIFLDASTHICYERMIKRGDSHQEAKKRIDNDQTAFAEARDLADLIIKVDNVSIRSITNTIWNYVEKCETGI